MKELFYKLNFSDNKIFTLCKILVCANAIKREPFGTVQLIEEYTHMPLHQIHRYIFCF